MSAPVQAAASGDVLRRGWCPSTLKPMQTGDGWLVRLHPPGSILTPAQLIRIAALARAHGNGLIEISARGNMQLRGVSPQTHPALIAALLDERLVDEHEGDGPQRLTLTSPLAGGDSEHPLNPHPEEQDARLASRRMFQSPLDHPSRRSLKAAPQDKGFGGEHGDLIDAAALANAIEAQCRTIPGLPAKTLVVVDGGGALSLDGFAADLRVVGIATGQVAIGLPDGQWRGPLAVEQASAAVETILRGFARLCAQAPETIRRLRDLSAEQLAALCDRPVTEAPAPRPPPARAGLFDLGDDRFAAIAALPFGRCDASALDALGRAAEHHAARALRLSPWRGLACLGLGEMPASAWLAEAQQLGLIIDDADPRLSVQACSGRPACLRAESDAMADAATLAAAAAPLLARGVTLHVSGCVKSCAHPGMADLTLTGRAGRYAVVLHGTTRDEAVATLDLSEIVRRLQTGQDLFSRLIQAHRNPGPQA